jgi:hypothetical protein
LDHPRCENSSARAEKDFETERVKQDGKGRQSGIGCTQLANWPSPS